MILHGAKRNLFRRAAWVSLLAVLAAVGLGRPAAGEEAVVLTAHAPELKWGSCPEFMPAGCGMAVLHGDPANANADVFFKVPGKSTIPAHWHTSPERMVLVAGELHVTYAGQPKAVLKPGMYAYGPPKAVHGASCESVGECILFIAFEAPIDAVAAAE